MRIMIMISQYFYPQRQTKVMNEGWATFWHYQILKDLYEQGSVDDGFMFSFLHNHTNVTMQMPYNYLSYNGINPYALGFAMMQDIKRICEAPDDQDKKTFPDIAGSNWLETFDTIMRNYKDSSFIEEFMSQKIVEKFKFFLIDYSDGEDFFTIEDIHDDVGYKAIRKSLAAKYNHNLSEPNLKIVNANINGSRKLEMEFDRYKNKDLTKLSKQSFKNIGKLWGYPVDVRYS